ncbi:hypothetical protein R3W88_023178 [Solanum pinnatisectum]|uniref:Uncharacterized protein n=1 Tax=Solanum pinnatisectum TaxID=50273 RepID=A0AAV9M019_9SOLN|nr:hypothetical protein R3W88_023178 [Solanum pinnatisectum]
MNGFTLISLRWYHGGVLDLSSGEQIYNGGKVTEFLDVDVDKMKTKKKTSSIAPSAPPLPTAPTDFPATSSAPPTCYASSSIAGTTKRGRGRGRGNTSPEKRPRVMGMGVFQVANGFKVMNPGMSSSKIYSTGQAKVTRSSDVTGDIGYTPSNTTKPKWNGKAAISTSKLYELREKQRKKTMRSSSSQNDTFSQSKMSWKL